MTPQYNRAAYRLSILEAIEAYVKERLLDESSPHREMLVCDYVFFKDRFVTEEAITEFLYDVEVMKGEQKSEMSKLLKERTEKESDGTKPVGSAKGSTKRAPSPPGTPGKTGGAP